MHDLQFICCVEVFEQWVSETCNILLYVCWFVACFVFNVRYMHGVQFISLCRVQAVLVMNWRPSMSCKWH